MMKKWAELIQKIYEITLSLSKMSPQNENYRLHRKTRAYIERILKHLGLLQPHAHAPPQNEKLLFKDDIVYDYSFFDSFAS